MGVHFEGALRSSMTAEALAERVRDRLPALADHLVLMKHDESPERPGTDLAPDEELWQWSHDNLDGILRLVAASRGEPDDPHDPGDPAGGEDFYAAARSSGRRRADRGLPLDDLLWSLRLAGRLVWDALTEEAAHHGEPAGQVLLEIGNRVWEVVDRTSAEVASAYHAAQRIAVRAGEQRRTSMWEVLLSGTAEETFLLEASQVLGLPADGAYLVVVGEAGTGEAGGARRLEELLRADSVTSAWQVRGPELVGLVALPHGGGGPEAGLEVALCAVRARCAGRAGVHGPVDGLAEVAHAARQAALTLQTLGPHDAVATLDERLPEALLLQAPELRERLVERWLGALLRLPEAERAPLVGTLDAWLRTSGSAGRTAALVHCHRNTVLNRLKRLQELIDPPGHDLTEGSVPLELGLAMRAYRLSQPR